MNAFGKAARVELKSDGIHVMTVCQDMFERISARMPSKEQNRDGTPVGSSRDQRSARRSRGVPRLSEAEAGSHRALDHASSDQDVSTFSRSGGMGDG